VSRKRVAVGEQRDQLAQFRHIFAAPLGEFDVTLELRAANQVSRGQIPKSLNRAPADLKRFPLPRSAASIAFTVVLR